MYRVRKNECIGKDVYLLEVEAPLVVKKCLPGQFVIVMAYEPSERIPLTIYDYDRETGILSLIYQVIGASTMELTEVTDSLFSVAGPLGNPSILMENDDILDKKILFVAGGVGIAPVYPQAKYLTSRGVDVDIIYGARTKDIIVIEEETKKVCNNLYITTDDGSYGNQGNVTDMMKKLDKKYDYCVAIGPVIMMKFVALYTKELGIKTIVSMNPIMVDGTGMCGACRLLVDGKVKFACVDGPEFDGHKVDFDNALKRMSIYKTEEGRKKLMMEEGSTHHGGCGNCGDK